MWKILHIAWLCVLALIVTSPSVASELTAQQVFDQLKVWRVPGKVSRKPKARKRRQKPRSPTP